MAYDHKKSLRTLTDEQFSDGTTVDGSRLDKALDEAVEHFNEVPGGDVSTRFTKTQYVFGYQPAPYTGTPNSNTGAFETYDGTIEGPTWPWNFIKNSEQTTSKTDASAAPPDTYGGTGAPIAGFQNDWRIKGTNYHLLPGAGVTPDNDGRWGRTDWEHQWATGEDAGGTVLPTRVAWRNTENAYQFAWSHSWAFPTPVILDAVSVMLRTDSPTGSDGTASVFGYYDAPFQYQYPTLAVYHSNGVSIHISVDNEFSKEDRSLNDTEYIFQDRWLDGYTVNDAHMTGAGPPAASDVPGMNQVAYRDMKPNSPEYGATGAGLGDGLNGRLIRHRDLNIPIRANARVRMSIVLPWMVAPTDPPPAGGASSGPQLGAFTTQGLRTDTDQFKFVNWAGTTFADWPKGLEPVFDFSVNGCITVLEQVSR